MTEITEQIVKNEWNFKSCILCTVARGEDMLISNGWHHCGKCGKRLIEVPHNKETRVLASMLVEYVEEYDVGYEPKVSDQWNTSLDA